MARFFVLNQEEADELFRQHPATARDGGFQAFVVRLQGQYRKGTQEIGLDPDDMDKIREYAANSKQGGWQTRMLKIFGRVLSLG
jgi:predicted amidohydrolase YtcJ